MKIAPIFATMGRRDEALAEIAKIDQLDYSSSAASTESWVYQALRDYPDLINASKRALLLNPNDPSEHYLLGVGYEGTASFRKPYLSTRKELSCQATTLTLLLALAHAYSGVGKKDEAEKILRDQERKLKGTADSSFTMAKIYASLGEKDKAFEFLEKAYSEKSPFMPANLKSDLVLDGLHSDPRFQNLFRRMRLNNLDSSQARRWKRIVSQRVHAHLRSDKIAAPSSDNPPTD